MYLVVAPLYFLLVGYWEKKERQALHLVAATQASKSLASYYAHRLKYFGQISDLLLTRSAGDKQREPDIASLLDEVSAQLSSNLSKLGIALVDSAGEQAMASGTELASETTLALSLSARLRDQPISVVKCNPDCALYVALPPPAKSTYGLVAAVSMEHFLEDVHQTTGAALVLAASGSGDFAVAPGPLELPPGYGLYFSPKNPPYPLTPSRPYAGTFSALFLFGPLTLMGLFALLLGGRFSRLSALSESLPDLASGNELLFVQKMARLRSRFPDELDDLASQLSQVALQLLQFRTTESTQLAERVRAQEQSLAVTARAELAAHYTRASEEERGVLACELHDELGQLLTALRLDLRLVAQALAENPEALQRVTAMSAAVSSAQATLERTLETLRPAVLETQGLVDGLQGLLDSWKQRAQSCTLTFSYAGDPSKMDSAISATLYRVAQEGVTNAIRHASPSQLSVTLDCTAPDSVSLTVNDNGAGFDPTQTTGRHGLRGMRERVAAFGGELGLHTIPGEGTQLTAKLPLDPGSV